MWSVHSMALPFPMLKMDCSRRRGSLRLDLQRQRHVVRVPTVDTETRLEVGALLLCPHCRRWHPVRRGHAEGTPYTRWMLYFQCRGFTLYAGQFGQTSRHRIVARSGNRTDERGRNADGRSAFYAFVERSTLRNHCRKAAKRSRALNAPKTELAMVKSHKHTGLRCPACKQPVAVIENQLPKVLVFWCPACQHRWSAEEPGPPKQ